MAQQPGDNFAHNVKLKTTKTKSEVIITPNAGQKFPGQFYEKIYTAEDFKQESGFPNIKLSNLVETQKIQVWPTPQAQNPQSPPANFNY